MIIAIFFAVLGFFGGIFKHRDFQKKKKHYLEEKGPDVYYPFPFSIGDGLISIAAGFLLGVLISALIGAYFMPRHWEETRIDLISLEEARGIEGDFFLGTDYQESTQTDYQEYTQKYIWFEKADYDGYSLKEIPAYANVSVFEDSTFVKGVLIIKRDKLKKKSLSPWWIIDGIFPNKDSKYKFIIPKGGLKKDFRT